MTDKPARRSFAAPLAAILHPGTLTAAWCPVCKAWTHITAELLLLTPDGVTPCGTWASCEICDDPDSPLPPRRIGRG